MVVWGAVGILLFLFKFLPAETIFPLPENLKPNVDFWIQVYSKFDIHQVVLHDRDNLQVIYEVVSFAPDSNGTLSREQWKQVEEVKKEYADILRDLGRKGEIDPSTLSPKAYVVYQLWEDIDQPDKFMRAIGNLRAQKGLRSQFRDGVVRSGRYLDTIKGILRQYQVPEDLAYLPHVESSFNYHAYSKLGAAGMWQFTRHTGRLFLKIDYSIDERLDPLWSSEAAAKLLAKNYEELLSWPLAITAYNHGLNGMRRAKRQLETDDIGVIVESYRGRSFGFASRNFYAEFLAAREIATNIDRYFGALTLETPKPMAVLTVPHYVPLSLLAQSFGLDIETLATHNPALRAPILKSQRRVPQGFRLRLPLDIDRDYEALYATIADIDKHDAQVRDRYYRVKRGDNLGNLARQFGTDLTTLMALNDIDNPHRIRVGQILELPGISQSVTPVQTAYQPVAETPGGGLEPEAASVVETKSTDLPQTSVAAEPFLPLRSALTEPEAVVGFTVAFEAPTDQSVVVEPEETLGHFAEWLGISAQRLRDVNGLPYGQEIQIGKKLSLIFTQVSAAEFHRRRLEYHKGIQEDFFGHFRIDSTRSYRIRSGDNIWHLCNRTFTVPLWLLRRLNPEVDIARLYPGETLLVPVVRPRSVDHALLEMEE
ncbi:LysM peptidoglycan-binding domain-containing protein [candidate division KSB1 bacterium]|nr:LysM peptidoglycan-binding domain-containing protein [candidate division KSB1 bacterium]